MHDRPLDLVARVQQLEKQMRCLRALVWILLGGLSAAILVAQAAPGQPAKAVEAERFVLKDGEGNERAVLGRLGARVFGLALLDALGEKRVVLSTDDTLKMPFITLRDQKGERRISMTLLGDGAPAISMRDGAGKTLAAIGCLPAELGKALPEGFPPLPGGLPDGQPPSGFLVLNGADGKELFKAP